MAAGSGPFRRKAVAVGCALALALAGCASGESDTPAAVATDPSPAEASPPSPGGAAPPPAGAAESAPLALIMATTTIWADITRNVACEGLAEVESILPPLADPHDFEPSMSDRARLDEAHLIVANGLELEEGLEDTLVSVEGDGTSVFSAGDYMTTLEFDAETFGGHNNEGEDDGDGDDHGDGDEDGDRDDHGGDDEDHGDEDHDDEDHGDGEDDRGGPVSEDPHVWLDPVRVAQAVENLADALVRDAGLDADRVAACTDAYLADLADLHRDIAGTLDAVPPARRKLVTNHDSLGYFADRYGFDVIGTIIPATSTLAEPSPAGLEELAHLIEDTGVRAIFAEELGHGAGEAATLADRLEGVSVENLYTGALGPPGSGAETYLAMMRHNAETIAAALAG